MNLPNLDQALKAYAASPTATNREAIRVACSIDVPAALAGHSAPAVDADTEREAYRKFFDLRPEAMNVYKHQRFFDYWLQGAASYAGRLQVAAPAPPAAAPNGMVLAPHYRGYANLGTSQYLLNHSAAGEVVSLIISVATEEEKAGRVVGDERANPTHAALQSEAMAVRIDFTTVAGLDALENQLRKLRAEHFAAAPTTAPSDSEPSELESVAACLGDDAVMISGEWPEVADNMLAAERLLEALAAPAPTAPVAPVQAVPRDDQCKTCGKFVCADHAPAVQAAPVVPIGSWHDGSAPVDWTPEKVGELHAVLAEYPPEVKASELPDLPGCLESRLYEAISIARDRAQHAGSTMRMAKWDATAIDLRAALAARSPVAAPQPDTLRYAQELATVLWERHYKATAPQWKVLSDLYGALSQIDNMTCKLVQAPQLDVSARDAALEEAAWACMLDLDSNAKTVQTCIKAIRALKSRAAPESAEPITNWYESMRRTLIGQVHELIDIAERSTWRKDDDDEVKRTEGAIAHARKVSSLYNYNGDGTTQRAQVLSTSSAAKGEADHG